MNRRTPFLLLLACPGVAWAHGPGWVYYLIGWELALLVGLVVFLLLPKFSAAQKLAGAFGFFAIPVLLMALIINTQPAPDSLADRMVIPVVALGPLVGWLAGTLLVRLRAAQAK